MGEEVSRSFGVVEGEPVGDYEYESEEDREDAETLARAEELILEIAGRHNPTSLSELREWLSQEGPAEIESDVWRAALWSLLNQNLLELTSDRTLRVAG